MIQTRVLWAQIPFLHFVGGGKKDLGQAYICKEITMSAKFYYLVSKNQMSATILFKKPIWKINKASRRLGPIPAPQGFLNTIKNNPKNCRCDR